jgi:hypothetical protein
VGSPPCVPREPPLRWAIEASQNDGRDLRRREKSRFSAASCRVVDGRRRTPSDNQSNITSDNLTELPRRPLESRADRGYDLGIPLALSASVMQSRSLERSLLWFVFVALWVLHATIAMALLAAFVLLPIKTHWYEWIPIQVFLAFFSSNEPACALTNFENVLRRRLGLAEIDRFVPHYLRVVRRAFDAKRAGRYGAGSRAAYAARPLKEHPTWPDPPPSQPARLRRPPRARARTRATSRRFRCSRPSSSCGGS